MTTVAWSREHGVIAADRQCSYHCLQADKLFKLPDGSTVGVAGDYEFCVAAIQYFRNEAQRPASADGCSFLKIDPYGNAFMCHGQLTWFPVSEPFFAIGSGRDYAMGAMAMGASPVDAVDIASRYDESTSNLIDCITLT